MSWLARSYWWTNQPCGGVVSGIAVCLGGRDVQTYEHADDGDGDEELKDPP